jgi:hypothetical protein
MASWFETRGLAALLTMRVKDLIFRMRVKDLILRKIATGSRECAPDDGLRDASRGIKPPNLKTL